MHGPALERPDQAVECEDAHAIEPELGLDLLDGGQGTLAALLAIEREGDRNRLSAGGPDEDVLGSERQ